MAMRIYRVIADAGDEWSDLDAIDAVSAALIGIGAVRVAVSTDRGNASGVSERVVPEGEA